MANTTTTTTTMIDGYRVQRMFPMSLGLLGAVCLDAEFKTYGGSSHRVEALVRIGKIDAPYTIVLSVDQALDADIIEPTE